MSKRYIERESIKPLIDNKTLRILDNSYCEKFNDFISREFPWYGEAKDRIDWDKIESFKQINWQDSTDEEVLKFLTGTCLGGYNELAIIFSSKQEGLIGPYNKVIHSLLPISKNTPWVLFIVGVSRDQYNTYKLEFSDFAELHTFGGSLTTPK